jgi:hypothetical protein
MLVTRFASRKRFLSLRFGCDYCELWLRHLLVNVRQTVLAGRRNRNCVAKLRDFLMVSHAGSFFKAPVNFVVVFRAVCAWANLVLSL